MALSLLVLMALFVLLTAVLCCIAMYVGARRVLLLRWRRRCLGQGGPQLQAAVTVAGGEWAAVHVHLLQPLQAHQCHTMHVMGQCDTIGVVSVQCSAVQNGTSLLTQ